MEISEDDFVLVRSGIPNKMIPPQPIGEDEEKELGTLEILEKALGNCVHLADQGKHPFTFLRKHVAVADNLAVAGRARQLNHKLKHRKNAIIARREAEVAAEERAGSPAPVPRTLEYGHSRHQSNGECASPSPTHRGGFVAVNKHPASNDRSTQNGNGNTHEHTRTSSTLTNGTSSLHSASAATRAELLSKFHTKSERSGSVAEGDHLYKTNPVSRPSAPPSKPNSKPYADSMEYAGVLLNTASPVPIPNTPSSLLPYVKPSPADRFDDSGPYKSDMMARMEQLNRGDRVQPPCDRCRRLHMDCLKNLTACMGCTKKHAKCSWKDVEEQELKDHPFIPRIRTASEMADLERSEGEGSRSGGEAARRGSRPILQEVRDEELLGEESADDELEAAIQKETAPQHSVPPPSVSPRTTTMEGHRPHLSDDLPSMTHSSGTNSTFDIIRDTNPSEPSLTRTDSAPRTPTAPFQAPQAQMQRFPSYDHSSSNNGSNGINGHVQTEYEKDIYSQLNEATRSSAELEKAITSAQVASTTAMSNVLSHEEPMRVYTAGVVSESYQADPSPARAPISAPQGEPMDVEIPRGPSPTTTYTPEIEKPQMPSPPLSSVPKQTASLPGTPGVEQVFGGQSLQT